MPTKRTSDSYAHEIADLLCKYEDLSLTWRGQGDVWKEIRKRLAQYRVAKQREQKEARRTLWTTQKK